MNINDNILDKVSAAGAQLVVVTKYFDTESTNKIIDQLKNIECVIGFGENRVEKCGELFEELKVKREKRRATLVSIDPAAAGGDTEGLSKRTSFGPVGRLVGEGGAGGIEGGRNAAPPQSLNSHSNSGPPSGGGQQTPIHWIGRIQSRKIPDICRYCSVVHSLDSLKHAEKFASYLEKDNPSLILPLEKGEEIRFFIQVNVSGEGQKGGIDPNSLSTFFDQLPMVIQERVVGISGMGSGQLIINNYQLAMKESDLIRQKREEFRLLKKLRDEMNPEWLISAGTSRDYVIALEEGIDIVRVGSALFE